MNEPSHKKFSGIGGVIAGLPEEVRFLIGLVLLFFIFAAGAMTLSELPGLIKRECWELQVSGERVFKINACTGEVFELSPEQLKEKQE